MPERKDAGILALFEFKVQSLRLKAGRRAELLNLINLLNLVFLINLLNASSN